jgi:transcriptional regulator with XRE-family HTH domain
MPGRSSAQDERNVEAAARVSAARNYARLTQRELADRLDLSLATVKRYESGDRPIATDELLAVSEATGVPAPFMLHGWASVGTGQPGETEQRLADLERRTAALEAALRRGLSTS